MDRVADGVHTLAARWVCQVLTASRHERASCVTLRPVTKALRSMILDLGVEDDIPLWEIADRCRAAGLIADGYEGVGVLSTALLDLARSDEIRILVGGWNDPEPRYVNADEAGALLADARRYASAEEIAHALERVYYVNVDNIVE